MHLNETLGAVALEAVLLLLLSRLLFAGVISSFADRRGKGLLLGLLRLPGNTLHELSHCLGFLLGGYRVKRVLLCIFDPNGRGSCTPGRAWSPITVPPLAIGISALMPLVVGSVVLIVAGRLLGVTSASLPVTSDGLIPMAWRQALDLLQGLDFHRWQTYLFIYLALSIGAELAPSSSDLRYALPTLLILALGVWLMFFSLDRAENLAEYRNGLATALQAGLLRLGSVWGLALVLTGAATMIGLVPGLMIQGLRGR